ncbi:MAG: DUF2845 domain-containing protein [Sinobacteraceae bacterium]|nr:DUF2845 domain-containing protein [Nevskiaceae bacterium]MCP5359479.1 DUF2845 domain-containing protein [Nevskiaceae bacterium]
MIGSGHRRDPAGMPWIEHPFFRRRRAAWAVALLLCLPLTLLAAAPAQADGFRCGTRLVVEGSTRGEVLARCGEPTDVERRSILRRPMFWRHGRPYYLSHELVEVPLEFWTYNLGTHKLMRRLRLEDGIVVEIETLGYGYRSGKPARRSSCRMPASPSSLDRTRGRTAVADCDSATASAISDDRQGMASYRPTGRRSGVVRRRRKIPC